MLAGLGMLGVAAAVPSSPALPGVLLLENAEVGLDAVVCDGWASQQFVQIGPLRLEPVVSVFP